MEKEKKSKLNSGEVIEVLPGDRIPVDATIQSSIGTFDESALTGESIPVNRKKDEKVMAGCMVVDKPVTLVVESEPGNNAIDRIITLIEEAEESRAPIARMVDKFSSWYTPLVMAIAALVMVVPPLFMGAEWMPWVYKALTLLLIACPCALVVSIPAAVTSALTSASRSGALIKGGAALEQLKNVKVLAFDKTGTLTQGKPKVTTIISLAEDRNELLKLAASLEQGSSHPLAKAIIEHSKEYGIDLVEPETIKVINGRGIIGKVDNREISILAPRYVHSSIMGMNELKEAVEEIESQGNTVVVILEGMAPLGIIGMADTLREDAVDAINDLKKMGIRSVMLTGDNRRAAASIAGRLSIDYKAELLPEDKVKAIQDLQLQNSGAVAMVGDGINDAPALKMAELGIAMGRGSDVALETADAALTHEKLVKLPVMIKLSQKTAKIIRQNIALALGINSFFLITTLFGVTGLMAAVLSDAGGTLLVTLNALRLMKQMKIE
jgi:Zn2+/Cd2+-exporting ATPase